MEGRAGFLPQKNREDRGPPSGLLRSPGLMAASGPQGPPSAAPATREGLPGLRWWAVSGGEPGYPITEAP